MRTTRWIFLLVVLGAVPLTAGAPYRGLFVMTLGTKSHMNFFGGVIDALVENGHEITLVSPHEPKNSKVRHIQVDQSSMDRVMENNFKLGTMEIFHYMRELSPEICLKALTSPDVEKALNETYDYVILSMFFADCFLAHINNEMKIPFIYASPNVLMSPYTERLGVIDFPSVCPYKILPITYPLSFFGRMKNAVLELMLTSFGKFFLEKRYEELSREQGIWSPETPSIFDLQKEASFAIINSVRSLEVPKKLVPPTVIYAGGIHIKPPKPLPEDIQEWLDGSGDAGFILFSLGTAVKPSLMEPEHFKIILEVFRSLEQRILWKWDLEDFENLPSNVKLSPWVPQQDILRHPKIRLFITHGGLFSTQEATYFGVPVIGMPVFGDQISNVAEIVSEGWGRRIKWEELTEIIFKRTIEEVFIDKRLHKTVAHRSALMKDSLSTPAPEVTFWVEYAVRHKGAKHMQSPFLHMPWYQIYNVDVWATVIMILLLILMTTTFLIKFCIRRCKRILTKTKIE